MIVINEIRQGTTKTNYHIEFEIDGINWRDGSAPIDTTDNLQIYLDNNHDFYLTDICRMKYINAKVVQHDNETLKDAWIRIITIDEEDDDGKPLYQCINEYDYDVTIDNIDSVILED
jgi:hypothetical protein